MTAQTASVSQAHWTNRQSVAWLLLAVRCRIVIACLSSLSLFLKLWKCYAKLPRLSVCVSVFRISGKRADRFPWNFSGFIGVIRKREQKNTENVDPWCLKILKTVQNCRFREGHAVEKRHGATALAARATCAARWRILWIKRLRTYRKLRDRVLFTRRRSNRPSAG